MLTRFLNRRKQLFIDPKVQGALLLRVAMYWICCLAVMNVMVISWEIFTSHNEVTFGDVWFRYAPALAVALLMLPFILFDTARVTNRLVGPVHRLRECMRRAARHEHVEPIQFRKDDFWRDFADEFNALLAMLPENHPEGRELEAAVAQSNDYSSGNHT